MMISVSIRITVEKSRAHSNIRLQFIKTSPRMFV